MSDLTTNFNAKGEDLPKPCMSNATIISTDWLTNTILKLKIKPDNYVAYHAGQYLKINLDKDCLFYSIANAPDPAEGYELHIKKSSDNAKNIALMDHLLSNMRVLIESPFGNCHIANLDPTKPILFIAAGTGFAPIKAMIEQLIVNKDQRHFELYWAARMQQDLYMDFLVKTWREKDVQFDYFSYLSEANQNSLVSVILDRHVDDILQWQIIMSGPFEMIYNLRDALLLHGVSRDNIFSDAFEYKE